MKHLERAFLGNKAFLFYVAVIIITFIAQAVISFFVLIAAYYIETGSLKGAFLDVHGMIALMDKNVLLCVLMIPFAISLLLMLILIKLIHKRSFSEVVNGTKSIRWNRIWFSFILWFGLMGIHTAVALFLRPDDFTLQFDISKFIPLLIISLALIPLQTTFEEVMVRGYLAQGVGTLTKSRWMALLLPALLFTVLHITNPEVREYGMAIMLTTYFTMALIWGLTSILDDGIEIGIGMHAANNIFISLFTSQQGAAFETHSVFEIAKSNPYIALLELIVMGSITIFIFYKKYNWTFTTLNKKIEKPDTSSPSVS